jgi:CheY-like chemotaxis protein
MNLVSNAVEAMPDGGRVTIQTRNDRQKASLSSSDQINPVDYVRLSVGDQGVGIAPEDQERIFEPFYTKKRMGRSGTGLGMAVVWGTVKDHDGTIEVKSETGQGTTFTIFIPATAKPLAALSERKSLDEIKGNGEKILIIDDVREQRIIATAMLQKLGYQVMAAADGEEALTVVESYDPDLLLLDMIMDPGMDGCETYQKILERRPGQKAVIASGFSESGRVEQTQRLGAGIYIRKPYAIEVLGLAIKDALARS